VARHNGVRLLEAYWREIQSLTPGWASKSARDKRQIAQMMGVGVQGTPGAVINRFAAGDLVEQIIALAKGPIEGNREPTTDEWTQMNALADQSHATCRTRAYNMVRLVGVVCRRSTIQPTTIRATSKIRPRPGYSRAGAFGEFSKGLCSPV